MEKLTIKAKSLDEAITQAMLDLNTTSDKLEYSVIKEEAGFLGLGKTVEVEFWLKGSNNSFEKTNSSSQSDVYEFKSEKAASAQSTASESKTVFRFE